MLRKAEIKACGPQKRAEELGTEVGCGGGIGECDTGEGEEVGEREGDGEQCGCCDWGTVETDCERGVS